MYQKKLTERFLTIFRISILHIQNTVEDILLSEGFRKDHVFVTGSPLYEVLKKNEVKIQSSDVVERLGLEKGKYIVVSAHREENIDLKNHFEILVESLNAVAEKYKMPIIFSTHPRTKKRIENSNITFNPLIKSVAPLGFFDYVKLQQNAYVVFLIVERLVKNLL